METVLGLTGYHCLGMSELFSDLGIAQCRLVFGCSLIWLRFLHYQSSQHNSGTLSDARQCRLTSSRRNCALSVNDVPFVLNAML